MAPEMAKAAEIVRKKMQQIVEKAQIAANPVDANTMRQIEDLLKGLAEE